VREASTGGPALLDRRARLWGRVCAAAAQRRWGEVARIVAGLAEVERGVATAL
jgi:hypothetical protein